MIFACLRRLCGHRTLSQLAACASAAVAFALGGLSFVQPLHAEDRSAINANLPRWMSLGVQSRVRAEGQHGLGFRQNNDQDYLLVRNRLSLAIKPKSWLQFFGEGQDARSAGISPPNGGVKDIFDLRQAWVGLGSESALWDLRIGRQKLAYGSERVIGAGEWGNTARVFDAAKLSLHRKAMRVDLFSASVVENDVDHWDHHVQGNNLHGAYASLGGMVPDAVLEPYLLYRTNPLTHASSWTSGLRTAGTAGPAWSYELEAIRQMGSVSGKNLRAWAATAQLQRHFQQARLQPTLLGEYNFASGDRNPGDSAISTYDQLYPTNHGIYGFTDQIGRRNTRNYRAGLWIHPRKAVLVRTEFNGFWLASRYDALYSAGGAVSVPAVAGGAVATHVGNECDFGVEFPVNRYYSLGGQYGHLFPGSFLKHYSPGAGRDFYAFYLDFRL